MRSIFIFLLVMALFSCESTHSEQEKEKSNQRIGGEKDQMGCLLSAGETWSQIREECIRIFEIGIRLTPIAVQKEEAILSSFLLIDEQQNLIELFLPNSTESILLEPEEENVYKNGVYIFDKIDSILYINDQKMYQLTPDETTE